MSSLTELKGKVDDLAQKVIDLKKVVPIDKDAVGATVKELLNAKRSYAEKNNGIGVDGKKWEEPLSKAEKKKREKAKKLAAAATASGNGQQTPNSNSKGAQKKASKKAEKAAKKAAAKESAKGGSTACKNAVSKKVAPKRFLVPSKSKIRPGQITFNPNAHLVDRPVIALSIACLTNTMNNYHIVSDPNRHSSVALGLSAGKELAGDAAIARYIARKTNTTISNSLLGADLEQSAIIDSWIDYANGISKFQKIRRVKAVHGTLSRVLKEKTFIVGNTMTMADVALFASIGFPSQFDDAAAVSSIIEDKSSPTMRWVNMMRSCPAIREATQIAMGISNDCETVFDTNSTMDDFVSGMKPLEGATIGNVVTRFPPEPSGYLHVGHTKAVLMNQYYAKRYKGRLIVRFDDTNPSKEKEEFQQSILEDLQMLGVKQDVVTFTSDYFETIRGYAYQMIENGLAFMDDTPQEEMQKQRMDRVNSKHRDQSIQDCKNYFELMCSGVEEGSKWCLRAKIDMTSVNGTMRDPVLYRQNNLPHHRSGDTYKAYPTYDLACPIVDSIEGVTHALRTTEYNDRDEQYAWIQSALHLRRVRVHAFSRLNFMYTELSKRKLTWFVENNYVSGWDDARMPTVRGVLRRGVHIAALRKFILSQGASRNIVNMEWKKFWAENKKEIDKVAKRFMAVDKIQNATLTVTNAPDVEDNSFISTDFLPKDPSYGKRHIRIAKQVLIEKIDIEGINVGENIVLMRWGVIKITKIDGVNLEGEYVPNGDFKGAKRKLSWIASVAANLTVTLWEFDNLISKEKLEEEENFKDFINPETLATTEVIGDYALKSLQKDEIIQLERRGYYRVDQPYMSADRGLSLFMIPDGKAKSMGGLSGKLSHR